MKFLDIESRSCKVKTKQVLEEEIKQTNEECLKKEHIISEDPYEIA